MAQLFPKWTNHLPTLAAVASFFLVVGTVGFVWYYFSPQYTDVGYAPEQPVEYSHKLHAGDLGIDCRYCHTSVETHARANIPPTRTCMNCHTMVKPDSEKLQPVLESFQTGIPIEWVRIHDLPDYAYFDHSVHVRAGVGCISCHGNVAQMDKVYQAKSLSMGWCLECHRDFEPNLRPQAEVTNMDWEPGPSQDEWVARWITEKHLQTREDCSSCHR